MKVLITGTTGFIDVRVTKLLLERGDTVVGVDKLNDCYNLRLNRARLKQLKPFADLLFIQTGMTNKVGHGESFQSGTLQLKLGHGTH